MSKSYPDTGHDDGHDELARVTLPRLSDEAVMEIHDFIRHLTDRFEACYGQQIDRFYQSLYEGMKNDPVGLGNWPP